MKHIQAWLLIIAFFVCSPAFAVSPTFYKPTKESAEKLQYDEAKATLESFYTHCGPDAWSTSGLVKDFRVYPDHIVLTEIPYSQTLEQTTNHWFDDMGLISVAYYHLFTVPNVFYLSYVSSNNTKTPHIVHACQISDAERANKLADALLRLKLEYDNRKTQDDEKFRKVVSDYHAESPKPGLSEEARKYRIQAELAVKDKRFGDAADKYSQALLIAPWWPEGHFDRALILGELKGYGDAISEMNKYLQLMPDAPDARAAQDKIYEWEDARKSLQAVHD